MDIKQMIYFKTIVEEGTISKAALTLHMAQPPLSMQLKQLERELNVQLIKRGRRKIELTPAGRLFYKRSLQIIALSEMTIHELQDSEKETLRIGITSSNSTLIENIADYFKRIPQLTFRIHEGTTYEMIDLLISHNIDVGIVRTPFDQSQVDAIYLEKEPMVAVAHYSLINESMTKITDYKDLPLIIHQRYVPLITDYCLFQQFNPFIKMSSDDCRTSIIWASAKLGIAIVPQSALSLIHDPSLLTIPLKDKDIYTSIAFITRKQENLDSRINEFIQQFTKGRD